MVVQHNMNAINAYNKLNANVAGMKKSSEKLSSGYRINRAGDDAAGLAISEKMRSQIKGLNQAIRNSQDGINMIQTFEGAAQETHSILQRMKELATESANGTYDNATDRAAIQLEFDQLNDELNQIADTDFNGTVVLNGGEMSDGLKADGNGRIDYSKADRQAQQLGWTGGYVIGIGKDAFITDQDEEIVTFTASVGDDGKVTWTKPDSAKGTLKTNDDNGGFDYRGATIHIDTTKVVTGDTVTVKFKNSVDEEGVVSAVVGTTTDYGTTTADEADEARENLTLTMEADSVTSQGAANGMNALNNLKVDITLAASSKTVGLKVNNVPIPTAADAWAKIGDTEDGGAIYINNAGEINYAAKGANAADGTKIATLGGITNGKAADLGANATAAGTATVTYNVSRASFTPKQAAQIEVIEPGSGKVSQSNSYDKSTAILTYAENITLQTGARTKDSVNFTFNYNSDKTADMGELKANLNLSARADGLNTENLSLATQKDANYAIDQIDKAINKTSMVRASFGSIQNRLEHKITNLTTTSENLTEAESAIRDTDMASEMMNYTKFNILQQAAQSMLAQANQQPQSILQLLG
ncbi:MAG: flagellin [Oscillospiraceae bacterium]